MSIPQATSKQTTILIQIGVAVFIFFMGVVGATVKDRILQEGNFSSQVTRIEQLQKDLIRLEARQDGNVTRGEWTQFSNDVKSDLTEIKRDIKEISRRR